MKLTRNKDGSPNIPKGWRKYGPDDVREEGDMAAAAYNDNWQPIQFFGLKPGKTENRLFTYIRRIKKGTK